MNSTKSSPTKTSALGGSGASVVDVSRDTRGLAIVLIFAAYENLLKELSRSILEHAKACRGKGRNLKSGIQAILVHSEYMTLSDTTGKQSWPIKSLALIDSLHTKQANDLNAEIFPNNGEFMRQTQVDVFCRIFDLPHAGKSLGPIYHRIDTIVTQRNQIAHGSLTADQVGRDYSHADLLDLIALWEEGWIRFIESTERACNTPRHFMR